MDRKSHSDQYGTDHFLFFLIENSFFHLLDLNIYMGCDDEKKKLKQE